MVKFFVASELIVYFLFLVTLFFFSFFSINMSVFDRSGGNKKRKVRLLSILMVFLRLIFVISCKQYTTLHLPVCFLHGLLSGKEPNLKVTFPRASLS